MEFTMQPDLPVVPVVPPTEVNLTSEQQSVIRDVVTGIKRDNLLEQTLGGYAGTGKTTLVSYLMKVFGNYSVCAFTGKAANVLRRKGVDASTIHSLIYIPVFDNGDVHWELAPSLDCGGIIVDEASMVPKELYFDLKAFHKPILFVGDHGQLEPVGSDINLMEKPDYTLEKIHRNAGDITKFAEWLRFGKTPRDFRGKGEQKVELLRKWDLTPSLITKVDQVICAFNKTRVEVNDKARKALGFSGPVQVGEKVMCLRNNKKLGIFNGMQGIVRAIRQDRNRFYMDFESYGTVIPEIRFDPDQFGQEKAPQGYDRDGPNPFDWAYCITAHKSQGDEWGDVLVIEQRCNKWEHNRWTYTCASRAKQKIRWLEA